MFSSGKTNEEYLKEILGDIEFDIFDEADVSYYCECNKEKVERALLSVGPKELQEMIDEGKDVEVSCQFCDKIYTYTPKDLEKLMKGNK